MRICCFIFCGRLLLWFGRTTNTQFDDSVQTNLRHFVCERVRSFVHSFVRWFIHWKYFYKKWAHCSFVGPFLLLTTVWNGCKWFAWNHFSCFRFNAFSMRECFFPFLFVFVFESVCRFFIDMVRRAQWNAITLYLLAEHSLINKAEKKCVHKTCWKTYKHNTTQHSTT